MIPGTNLNNICLAYGLNHLEPLFFLPLFKVDEVFIGNKHVYQQYHN